MGQLIPYWTRWKTDIVTILRLYGSKYIFIMVFSYNDTQSESWEMKNGVARPILTQKKIKQSLGQQYPYPKIWGKRIVAIIHVYGDRAIFLLFCDHQDTKSKSQEI